MQPIILNHGSDFAIQHSRVVRGHPSRVYSACSTGDESNTFLWGFYFDNSIRLRVDYINENGRITSPSNQLKLRHYEREDGSVVCLEISPNATYVAASTMEDLTVTVWEWGEFSTPTHEFYMGDEPVEKIAFSPSEERVAACDVCSIGVWDLQSGTQIYKNSNDSVLWGVSPDGGLYVQWYDRNNDDGRFSLGVLDPSTDSSRELVNFGMFDEKFQNDVVISDDGTSAALLAIKEGADQCSLTVWDIADPGSAVLSITLDATSYCPAISPDGKFVSCFVGNHLLTWRVGNGAGMVNLQNTRRRTLSVLYSEAFIVVCSIGSASLLPSPHELAKQHREEMYALMSVFKKQGENNSVSRDIYGLSHSIGSHIHAMIQEF